MKVYWSHYHLFRSKQLILVSRGIEIFLKFSCFCSAIGLHKKSVDMNIGMTNGWMYHLYSYMIVAALVVHTLTIVLDVFDPEVYTDIALLGDDVCIILGVSRSCKHKL